MRARIHNRSGEVPSDGWFQIEVTGEHPAGKNRRQVIDQVALTSIVNRFQAEAAGDNFPGLLVDNDHLSHDLANSTEALAWAKELRIRDGQLEARLDLTDIGEPAIRNKRFKFFSTEYDPEDLEDLGGGRVRPLRLAGLAFTNRPNNRGAKPISNRDGDEPGGEQTKKPTEPKMQTIAQKLGLPADADEAAILAKITSIMSELEAAKGKEAGAEADAIMNRLGSRVPEAVRPLWREKLLTNREETEKLMEASFPVNPQRKTEEKIFNRETAKQPAAVSDGDGEKAEATKKAAAIRNRAMTIQREQGLPYNRAFNLAQAELS